MSPNVINFKGILYICITNPCQKMNTYNPEQVKKMVSDDLKKRNLTQKELASIIGITRQTLVNILSSYDKYFTEKQATLFSIALGYDRDFLTTGEGSLIANNPDYTKDEKILYLEKRLQIFTKVAEVSKYITTLSIKLPKEKCLPLLKKAKGMHDLLSSIYTCDPRLINPLDPFNPKYMDAAQTLFEPVYMDILKMLDEDYDFEFEL